MLKVVYILVMVSPNSYGPGITVNEFDSLAKCEAVKSTLVGLEVPYTRVWSGTYKLEEGGICKKVEWSE